MIQIIGLDKLLEFLRDLPEHSYSVIRKGVEKTTANIEKGLKQNTTSILQKRTGALHDSIGRDLQGTDLKTLTGQVWIGTHYAKTHEFGATIKAKNKYMGVPSGPYLNIPIPNFNLDGNGIMKQSAREVFSGGGYIQKSKNNNWIVFSFDGKPMFVLKKQVKIKPRLGMFKLLKTSLPTLMADIKQDLLKQ